MTILFADKPGSESFGQTIPFCLRLTQFSGTDTQPIEINNPFGSGTCITIRAGGSFGKNSAAHERLVKGWMDFKPDPLPLV
jgi:hypothetical protein